MQQNLSSVPSLEELQSAIAAIVPCKSGARLFGARLRHQISLYAHEQRKEGVAMAELSERLKISPALLGKWLGRLDEREPASNDLLAVRVDGHKEEKSLVLRGPAGMGVEGLSLEDIAKLFRLLGA